MSTKNSVSLQNLTRGVLAISRSHTFRKGGETARRNLQASVRTLLIKAGTQIPPSQFGVYIEWADRLIKSLAPGVSPIAAPDYLSLSNLYEISGSDWKKTAAWIEARLTPYKDQLKKFYADRDLVEERVLQGKLNEAADELQRMEREYGPSITLIELRLGVESLRSGIEGQKKIAAQMRATGQGGLVGLIIYLVSVRNENEISLENFRIQVETRAAKFKEQHFALYLRFRLLREEFIDKHRAAQILQVEENHTIYDIAYTAHQIVKSFPSQELDSVTSRLYDLTRHIFRENEIPADINFSEILSSPLTHSKSYQGDIKNLYRLVKRRRILSVQQIRFLGFVRACRRQGAFSNRRSLVDAYAEAIANQLRGITNIQGDTEIEKIALNHCGFSQSAKLYVEAKNKRVRPAPAWPGATSFQMDDVVTMNFLAGTIDGAKPLLEPIGWLTSLQTNKKREHLKSFVEYFEQLEIEKIAFPVAISLQITSAYAYTQLNLPAKVSSAVSTLALDHFVRLDNLPIQSFYERHKWETVAANANMTQTAIALELYSRTVSSAEIESYKKYAIEDLLIQTGKLTPSQLSPQDCGVSTAQYNYFMHVVCVQKNLDMLHPLKSTAQLDNERKAILALLAATDKQNASEYNSEILSILHKNRIAQGVALLDRSRIHVDEDPLINKLSLSLSEKWNRYRSYAKPEETTLSDLALILRTMSKSENDSEIFKVPKNESASLLLEIVAAAQDAFLHDIDHGFDRYLGHRVRHNAFANQVRGGLSESHILTKQSNGQYSESEYWSDRLADEHDIDRRSALEAMKEFSQELDSIIQNTKENYLRARRADYPNGIFDILLSSKAFYLIEKYVSKDSNISTFISGCFQLFWQLLTPSLNEAKLHVQQNFSEHVSSLFSKLLKTIKSLSLRNASSLELAIVQAKNDTSKAIEQASKWFSKSSIDENSHVYSVKDAVDIVVEACFSSHRGAEPTLIVNAAGDIEVHPPALYQLSDILWIIIDNACSHSGKDRGVSIELNLRAYAAEKNLVIETSNAVEPHIEASANNNLNIIRTDIEGKKYHEKLMVEGKSGLKKLAAMSARYPEGVLSFAVEDHRFRLQLSIPLVAVYIPGNGKT